MQRLATLPTAVTTAKHKYIQQRDGSYAVLKFPLISISDKTKHIHTHKNLAAGFTSTATRNHHVEMMISCVLGWVFFLRVGAVVGVYE